MKRLLLTSTGFTNPNIAQRFLSLYARPIAAAKVLFVPTAARSEGEMKYVRKSEAELIALSVKKGNIIWFDDKNPTLVAPFNQYDVVYVCGGNTFHLMQRLLETGLDKEIKALVENGTLYVGVSAGSVAAGPHIKVAEVGETGDTNDVGLKSITGMSLTDKVISPHYETKDKPMLDKLQKSIPFRIIPLSDAQTYEETAEDSKVFE